MKELLHPDLSKWLNAVTRGRRASRCAASARRSARRSRSTASISSVAAGRDLRARRPERRRQEHADERSSPARSRRTRARCRSTARPYAPRNPLEARRAGVAMIYQELSLAPHLRDGEHPARRRADALRPRRSRRGCATMARARARELGHDDIAPDAPVGTPVGRRAAARRDRARARRRLPRARPRRADEQPRPRRRRAAVRPARAG